MSKSRPAVINRSSHLMSSSSSPTASKSPGTSRASGRLGSRMTLEAISFDAASASHVRLKDAYLGGLKEEQQGNLTHEREENSGETDDSPQRNETNASVIIEVSRASLALPQRNNGGLVKHLWPLTWCRDPKGTNGYTKLAAKPWYFACPSRHASCNFIWTSCRVFHFFNSPITSTLFGGVLTP